MVFGYWDVADSLVKGGAIHRDSFRAAHGENVLTSASIHPSFAELREQSGEGDSCRHLKAVVLAAPHAEAFITRRLAAALLQAQQRASTAPSVAA